MLETGRLTRERKKELESAYRTAMDDLRERLNKTVQSIADEKGYDLVISNQTVITGAASLDITEEVLKRFNEEQKAGAE